MGNILVSHYKMSKFYEIFSKKTETLQEKTFEKPKIKVDYREKNCLVPSEIEHLGAEVEFVNLEIGDYIVKDTVIERKTINDFISSMTNKHLINQLINLQQIENKLLIIEGTEEQELYSSSANNFGISENAIRGFILSILLNYKVPIIFTKDYSDSAKFMLVLSKKQSHEIGINAKRKSRDINEQMQYIIEGFPGIGPKTAKKLLEHFGTIKNIINADENEIKSLIGKKSEIFKINNKLYQVPSNH